MTIHPSSPTNVGVSSLKEALRLMWEHASALATLAAPWCLVTILRDVASMVGVHPLTYFALSATAVWLTAALMRALFVIAVRVPSPPRVAPLEAAAAIDAPVLRLSGAIIAVLVIGSVQVAFDLYMISTTAHSAQGVTAVALLLLSGVVAYLGIRSVFPLVALGLGVPSALRKGWALAKGNMLSLLLISLVVSALTLALSALFGIPGAVRVPTTAGWLHLAVHTVAAGLTKTVCVVFSNLAWGAAYRHATRRAQTALQSAAHDWRK